MKHCNYLNRSHLDWIIVNFAVFSLILVPKPCALPLLMELYSIGWLNLTIVKVGSQCKCM